MMNETKPATEILDSIPCRCAECRTANETEAAEAKRTSKLMRQFDRESRRSSKRQSESMSANPYILVTRRVTH